MSKNMESEGDGSGDSGDSVNVHPFAFLFVPGIFEKIAEYLSIDDLMHCRSFSPFIDDEIDRILEKNVVIKIHKGDSLKDKRKAVRKIRAAGRRIYALEIYGSNFDITPCLIRFVTITVQPTLARLTIYKAVAEVETIHKIMRDIGHNLIDLWIIGVQNEAEEQPAYIPIFDRPPARSDEIPGKMVFSRMEKFSYNGKHTLLIDVIETFPNLIKLDIVTPMVEDPEVYKTIRMPRLAFLKVRGLNKVAVLQKCHFNCFMNLELKLSNIDIMCVDKQMDPVILKEFLATQKSSLEDIFIGRFTDEDCAPENQRELNETQSPFPVVLPNVRIANFHKRYVDNMESLLDSLPNVEELCFGFGYEANWTEIIPKDLKPHDKVRKLIVKWIHPAPLLARLGYTFPNLTSLSIHNCTDLLLKSIFESMLLLQKLELYSPEDSIHVYDIHVGSYYLQPGALTDTAFTGIKEKVLQKLSPDTKVLKRNYPYIGDLKHLNNVTMNMPIFKLTSKAFTLGILQAENLKIFKIDSLRMKKTCPDMIQLFEEHGFECVQNHSAPGHMSCRVFVKRNPKTGRGDELSDNGIPWRNLFPVLGKSIYSLINEIG